MSLWETRTLIASESPRSATLWSAVSITVNWLLMLPIYKIIRFICILHILQPISAIEDCSQYVRQLSKYDEFLNGRRPTAQSLIFQNVTIQGFINAMRDKDSVEPGEKYQCGFTRWVIARSDKSASHPFSCLSLSLSDFGQPIPVEFKRQKSVS